jgi:N-methylhydantoinase B
VGNKQDDIIVEEGDQLHFITWGGGGWGDPLERDPALVALEILRGLVTREGAKDYGVKIAADGTVDSAGTEALRTDMRAHRKGALPLFNYGPDLKTLQANCLAETGLPAPRPPVWTKAHLLAAE